MWNSTLGAQRHFFKSTQSPLNDRVLFKKCRYKLFDVLWLFYAHVSFHSYSWEKIHSHFLVLVNSVLHPDTLTCS